uniref:Armadillo repeat containing protein n=1 Tax=Clytia hemisphaerica TaxID=252671 RepID=A0A7M5VB78_9CNID
MSFFNDPDSILVKNTETFTRAFLDIVLTKNQDCCVEAMRALGNFTQSEDSRRLLVEGRGLQAIIMLLDSSSIDLAFCVCGVLINMMVDRSTRTLIKNDQQTISKFVDLLKNAVDVDWALVGLVCQILWNYTEDMNSTHEYFDDIDAEDLITTLTDFTDPSIIATMLHPQSSTNETETREEVDEEYEEHFKESWGEFLPIGQSLLQRMEQCHSHLEPLVTPPD